ncbi:hypothetical protein DPMN_030723 [Dreissena polymorpha]|uniref:Uncharacterized protein n=1 Tax=Dreissena polymorpha TaxID=45954 RepID=A0A9D4M0X6_DREPO|nr:hypothetical protein DPMN_030723 [Dreissena polymorpha]
MFKGKYLRNVWITFVSYVQGQIPQECVDNICQIAMFKGKYLRNVYHICQLCSRANTSGMCGSHLSAMFKGKYLRNVWITFVSYVQGQIPQECVDHICQLSMFKGKYLRNMWITFVSYVQGQIPQECVDHICQIAMFKGN